MAEVGKADAEQGGQLEEEVWNAISAFEQILEAMPEDRASLEALAHAYEQIGDHTRAKDYLLRLGEVLLAGNETAEAGGMLAKLRAYVAEDERAREMVGKIEALMPDGPVVEKVADRPAGEAPAPEPATGLVAEFSIADELSVAWHLLETEELTQDEYSSVVQDLTEMSAKDSGGTVSVLHVLEFRGARNLERIMRVVSQECATPILSLDGFELQLSAASALPLDFMLTRGVLVFDYIGSNALVVVMNPYDTRLREDVAESLGTNCHFYMALPSDFDRAVGRLKSLQETGVLLPTQ